MPCQVISCWTLSTLVGAFLDLAIAYFLLCGSALAYSASKFLALFGLRLPCPCNGLFGNPNMANCLQKPLVDCPFQKLSSVRLSVKRRFPFNSILNDDNPESQSKWSELGAGAHVVEDSPPMNQGRWLGNGRLNQKLRQGLRQRRRAGHDHVKVSSSSSSHSSCDSLQYVAQQLGQSVYRVGSNGNGTTEESIFLLNPEDVEEASHEIGIPEQVFYDLENDEHLDKSTEKDSPLVEFKTPLQSDVGFDVDKESVVGSLKKSLEEAHASCSALYLELEKERSAAATAADEAMAMILRLQEEKAAIEMEARQYHRMVEEKAAYDAEEMNILTEILLRREKEKHFLELEVETYRQFLFEKEQSDVDLHDKTVTGGQIISSFYSDEEPQQVSEQLVEPVIEKEKSKEANGFPEYDTFTDLHSQILKFGKELPIPEPNEDSSSSGLEVEKYNVFSLKSVDCIKNVAKENGMAYKDKNPLVPEKNAQPQGKPLLSSESSAPQELNGLVEISVPILEEEPTDVSGLYHGFTRNMNKSFDESKTDFQHSDQSRGQNGTTSNVSDFDIDFHVHDIHVVSDEFDMDDIVTQNKSREKTLIHHALSMPKLNASETFGGLRTELERKTSSLERSGGLPPTGPSRRKAFGPDFRRNSMSAFDSERLKIDLEVGWLSDRLKIVQEGREKLKLSLGHKERGKLEMQILDNIASQFRQIRQLAEPGNGLEQAFSPPPFSKEALLLNIDLSGKLVMTKKRRPQTVFSGVQKSI